MTTTTQAMLFDHKENGHLEVTLNAFFSPSSMPNDRVLRFPDSQVLALRQSVLIAGQSFEWMTLADPAHG